MSYVDERLLSCLRQSRDGMSQDGAQSRDVMVLTSR